MNSSDELNPKICELAVDGPPCIYGNGRQLFICCTHRLNAAKRKFLKTIPAIADEYEDYVCPLYEEKRNEKC